MYRLYDYIVPTINNACAQNSSNVSSNNYIFYDTANYPLDVVKNLPAEIETGIYFGWASVDGGIVHKMVMSIGWNPYFDNKEKSMVCDSAGSAFRLCH